MNRNQAIQTTQVQESLGSVQQRFAEWRGKGSRRGRIPHDLWRRAVEQSKVHGVGPTAKALGLHAGTLKEHAQVSDPASHSRSAPVFVELAPRPMSGCTVELIRSGGTTMRVEISGSVGDELRLLTETFLGCPR